MDEILTLTQIRVRARKLRTRIVAWVIFADDRVEKVEAGPRGGWRIVK